MDEFLADYKSYYKARMDRYENDPLFTFSYQSEKALSDAMDSCEELIEFKNKIGDLNIKNAIALVKDQETARYAHYTELKEDIRKLGPQWILEKIEGATDVNAVMTISMEMDQKASLAITMDGFIDTVWQDLIPQLESLEVIQKAAFPNQYESDRQSQIQDIENDIRSKIKNIHDQAQDWDPNFILDYDLVWEYRHRKKIPINDAMLNKRLNELKKYT